MRLITFDEIKNLNISPIECIEWAEYVTINKKKYILPEKVSIKYNDTSFFNTMPCYLPEKNIFGVKVVSRIPSRTPSLSGDILLYDTQTGNLLSFMDGTWITTMRTGAIATNSIQTLKKDTSSISFIGLGNTARATLLCYQALNPNKKINVKLFEYKNQHILFMKRFKNFTNISFTIESDIKKFIQQSDVLVSCITATQNTFSEPNNYPKGILVVPVHTRGFENCDLVFDKIFCDDISHVQDFKYFKQYKYIKEMTEVSNNYQLCKISKNDRILVYNIGIAIQDIYFASKIYEKIKEQDFINKTKFWV